MTDKSITTLEPGTNNNSQTGNCIDDNTNSNALNNNPEVSNSAVVSLQDFSLSGFQVVHGEFFAHLFEPSVTLKDGKVSVNAACLRKLPTVEFVQFLVHPEKKLLAVKPCSEDSKDSFRWCSPTTFKSKRKPKSITCKVFYAKVMELMRWNPTLRYKIIGKLIVSQTDKIFVFDLKSAEAYLRKQSGDTPSDTRPRYLESWKDQFGVPVEEHDDSFQLNIFDDSVVFHIDRAEEQGTHNEESKHDGKNTI